MDLIYKKYEQFTKCKPHTDPAFFVCIHPYCLGRFICPKCIFNHNPDHKRHLTPVQDFFACAVQPRLEEEAQKEQAKEVKTKKEVNQIIVKVDEMFQEFEKEFTARLAEIKTKVKQELSEPLKETKLGSRFWNHLKDKLVSSYSEFIKKGMLDEVLLYNYISAYDKATAKLNEVSIYPSLLNEEEMSQQSNVNIDYKPLDLMFSSMSKILEDFSLTISLRPSLSNSSKRISVRKTSLGTGNKLSQRTFESPEDKAARTARKISEPISTLSGADFPKFFVVRRESKNYPLSKVDQSAIRAASAIVRRRESVPNLRRHVYTLDNLKQFDSGHEGIISAAIQIQHVNQIVTGGREGKIKFWDQATFKLVRTIDAHKTKIFSLKYIVKKNLLVSASQDCLIKVFKLDMGSSYKTWTLLGHRGPVTALEYASNLESIISGGSSKDKTIKIWDVNDFSVEFEFTEPNQGVFSMLYVEGMCVLFAGFGEGTVGLYDMEKKTLKFTVDTSFGEHSKAKDVVGIAVSEEQQMLYCGNLDGSVSIWDMKHYPFTATRKFANGLSWSRFLFLPKKGVGIVTGRDRSIRIVDLSTGETQRIFELIDEEGAAITFIEKNQVLITDLKTSSVKLWTLVRNEISP